MNEEREGLVIAGPNKEVKQLLKDVVCEGDTVKAFKERYNMSLTMRNLMKELYPTITIKQS